MSDSIEQAAASIAETPPARRGRPPGTANKPRAAAARKPKRAAAAVKAKPRAPVRAAAKAGRPAKTAKRAAAKPARAAARPAGRKPARAAPIAAGGAIVRLSLAQIGELFGVSPQVPRKWIADGLLIPKRETRPATATATDIRTMLREDLRAQKPRISAKLCAAYAANTKAARAAKPKPAAARKPVKRARAA